MRLLIFSSVYPPDPASVGQHIADVATALSSRGHFVRVITANRGYDDPSIVYRGYERLGGVEVLRLGWSSFGKTRYFHRIISQMIFTIRALVKGLLGYRPDVILVSTIPPLGVLAAWITARMRRSSLIYWVMDINPDEAIAMRLVDKNSLPSLFLDLVNKAALKSAHRVIALDSQMAKRLESKAMPRRPAEIIAPWPHEDTVKKSAAGGRAFRKAHGLEDKFVVMYSGNHSWVHPLDTILDAASSLARRMDIVFLFVGGGLEKHKVEKAIRCGAPNLLSLPYQRFEDLGELLAAADTHLVVMGDTMVGIVHPCKIYNAMAAGRPILAIAPDGTFISEIMAKNEIGFRRRHGDVAGVVQDILSLADMKEERRHRLGENAARLTRGSFSQVALRNRLIDILESASYSDR